MNNEEKKLWELYKKTGRPELQEEIVIRYLRLVHYIANRLVIYASKSLDKDDLYSAGVIGLLEAIERFDHTKGVEFKTYAGFRIRGAIIDEIRRFDWVPRSVRQKAKKIDSAIHYLFSTTNQMPSDDEIAKELDISLEEYYQITDNLGPMFLYSLDSEEANQNPSYSTSESEMVDNQFEDYESEKLKQEMKTKLMKGIQSLPEKERIVISLYYYEQLNLKEIGVIIGVTESRVSQIHSSAIVKLRNMIELIN
ncbi:MAG: FliA/WhiG family RNA polymerase sigma factor [Candidatus Cloacimonadales bacterium]|mgnify:CR=1 FL=1|jgi:RNA polymerase sigma factor for flagellar operon FliA|nr:FliA/WhiG family RNA polymerase sigma factor [Candidatus Cloacimonadota bacterium]MDX9977515.1 FliA/WhiG family RNA polymerase sigma factor [Candidatus Cloacimonadales bacterium]